MPNRAYKKREFNERELNEALNRNIVQHSWDTEDKEVAYTHYIDCKNVSL